MKVGITDTLNEDKFDAYVRWMAGVDGGCDVIRLSHREGTGSLVEDLDGLLLSGGGDVHPGRFGREDALALCSGVDEGRDGFELDVIERALKAELPLLGVCRGMQVMNVALGGSLVPDLETDGFKVHKSPAPESLVHPLAVVPHSLVHALAGTVETEVNSFHHQAVNDLGRGLVRAAMSPDGVTEAAEWAIKDGMSFLLLVQWHPERAPGDALSQNIMKLFLREVHHYESDHSHH